MPDSVGGGGVPAGGAFVPAAGSLLGANFDADRHAVYSWRRSADFRATLRGNGSRSGGGGRGGGVVSGNVWVFGLAVLVIGVLCTVLRVDRIAYRYSSITLAIVMLVTRSTSPGLIAIHRFLEVSVGIAVGLLITAVWPERQSGDL